jgi:hypothetical protein
MKKLLERLFNTIPENGLPFLGLLVVAIGLIVVTCRAASDQRDEWNRQGYSVGGPPGYFESRRREAWVAWCLINTEFSGMTFEKWDALRRTKSLPIRFIDNKKGTNNK